MTAGAWMTQDRAIRTTWNNVWYCFWFWSMSDLMFHHHLCQCKAQGRSRSCNMGPNPLCKLPSSIIKCRVMGEEWGIVWHKVSILKIGMPVPVGFWFPEMPCQCLHYVNVTCKYSKIFFLELYEILGRCLWWCCSLSPFVMPIAICCHLIWLWFPADPIIYGQNEPKSHHPFGSL